MFKLPNISNLLINNKQLIKYLIIIFVLFLTNIVLSIIKDNNELEAIEINNNYNTIKQLNSDEFILKHLFKEDKNNTKNFIEYIKKYLKNNHCEIINIKTINSENLHNIKVDTIEFDLTFPHDKFIFELLEIIQNYSPGFVKIIDIYIKKDEIFNLNKNNLKTKILCSIYTK